MFWKWVLIFTFAHLVLAIVGILASVPLLRGLRLHSGPVILILQIAGAILMPVVALAHRSGLQRMLPEVFWLPIWLANSLVWGLLLAYLRALWFRRIRKPS